MELSKLSVGQKGKIVKIKTKGELKRRLKDMGITKGEIVNIEKVAPLGDPIEVSIKGYRLSLRKDEAQLIDVEVLE